MANTIYWHDYETFGRDPRRDRPSQFAGIRTDEELNIVGDPLMIYCQPAPDFLPDPESCLITGISPLRAVREGLPESEFCARIHAEFARPGSCAAGYNSIRFDDEVSRHLFYRCFFDPYEREWKNGNSRWDILDMLRLARAVRPEGINWPVKEDGSPSFKLEDLTRENGIGHEGAHDALADVTATIEVARLVRRAQPKLYDWVYRCRFKQAVLPMLEPGRASPLLHVSGMYPASRGCLAVVLPLARDPRNGNGVIVCDLSADPSAWLGLEAEEIRARLFTPSEQMPEGVERIPLKTVHANRCPALAPLSVLDEAALQRWEIDLEACRRHEMLLRNDRALPRKLAAVFGGEPRDEGRDPFAADPDGMLYSGGFFDNGDRALMAQLRTQPVESLSSWQGRFHDPRLPEMLFRYRARNFPDTLSAEEGERWRRHCRDCLMEGGGAGITWQAFWARLDSLARERPERKDLLRQLEEYASGMGSRLGLPAVEPSAAEARA